MFNFDWKRFCDSRGVAYVTTGKNVSGNRIAIKCPLCGDGDPSQHMVLSLDRRHPNWSCWRNTDHRGASPVYLVARLAHVTTAQARAIVGDASDVLDDEWAITVAKLRGVYQSPERERPKKIAIPKGVRELREEYGSKPFLDYLVRRGFDDPLELCREVELYYARFGEYSFRLIFPIRVKGKLVALIGRDITGKQQLRYKATPDGEAAADLGTIVYNQDAAMLGGRILWGLEGPIDALKMTWYGSTRDVAVCFFGMAKRGHIRTLSQLIPNYDLTLLALDQDAMSKSMRLRQSLVGHVESCFLPSEVKDVGAMSCEQVKGLVRYGKTRLRTKDTTRLTSSLARRTAAA